MEEVIEALLMALRDKDTVVRWSAAWVLASPLASAELGERLWVRSSSVLPRRRAIRLGTAPASHSPSSLDVVYSFPIVFPTRYLTSPPR